MHCVVAAAMAITAPALYAQSGNLESIPNGPYGDNDSIASLRSYAQLIRRSRARCTPARVQQGCTRRGKATPVETCPTSCIGTGPTAALIIAQQHGDEMETSDSAVNLVRTLVE